MKDVYVLLADYGDGSSLDLTVYGEAQPGLDEWMDLLIDQGLENDGAYINTWNGQEASYIDASIEIRLERREVL